MPLLRCTLKQAGFQGIVSNVPENLFAIESRFSGQLDDLFQKGFPMAYHLSVIFVGLIGLWIMASQKIKIARLRREFRDRLRR